MSIHKLPDEDAPRKIVSQYNGKCYECEERFYEGDEIIWNPRERRTYCLECGESLL